MSRKNIRMSVFDKTEKKSRQISLMKKIHIGFIGSPKRITKEIQKQILNKLEEFCDFFIIFHQGDCKGSDIDFFNISHKFNGMYSTCLYPPKDYTKRAFNHHSFVNYQKETSLQERNKTIIDRSNIVIFCYHSEFIDYAKKNGKEIFFL